MTTLREAAEMALEALEEGIDNMWSIRRENSIQALRQALAQPEQEPVACVTVNGMVADFVLELAGLNIPEKTPTPLYTTPQKCKWVGLTDEEVKILRKKCSSHDVFAKAIEAKLKEKNT